jgi:hypothetical protein
MNTVFWAWGVSAAVIGVAAAVLGATTRGRWWGIIVDTRGRCSLSQLQIVVWSVIVLSLIAGMFFGRLFNGVVDPLNITIPSEVLLLLGISIGSTTLSTAIKSAKDATNKSGIAAAGLTSPKGDAPLAGTGTRFSQVFLVEEGEGADQVIDVTKFQNFWLTLILAIAYVALAIQAINMASSAAALNALPGFDATFVTLLGISHAGYLAGKLPTRPGAVQARGATFSLGEREALPSLARTPISGTSKPTKPPTE